MQNFVFEAPTKIIFGKGQIGKIGAEMKSYGVKKAMLVYGMGSVKSNGVHEQVVNSLNQAGISFTEFGSVRSNPILSHTYKGIKIAQKDGVDAVLAVGGGSVIDTAKTIAFGVYAQGDLWDFFTRTAKVQSALPIFCVLTISASASEMNGVAVITNEDGAKKFSVRSQLLAPRVSILDPTTLFSLSAAYTAYSAVDVIAHILEAYFNNSAPDSPLQDGLSHTLIKTVISSTEVVLKHPRNYDGRANFMWSATLGFNGLTSAGLGVTSLPVHMIAHSLSALYDLAHGATLSIILPAWMRYFLREKESRLALLGKEILGADNAAAGIDQFKSWFGKIGAPVSLSDAGIPATDIPRIAANANELARAWSLGDYDRQRIAEILRLA